MSDTHELISFLLKQFAMDEQTARAMPHAIEHLESRWSPAKLLADCAAKRAIVKLYTNALSAHRNGSVSDRNNVQDEAALDVLEVAIRELAAPYAHLRGYRKEWTP